MSFWYQRRPEVFFVYAVDPLDVIRERRAGISRRRDGYRAGRAPQAQVVPSTGVWQESHQRSMIFPRKRRAILMLIGAKTIKVLVILEIVKKFSGFLCP